MSNIRSFRKHRGLTQEALAEKAKVSQPHYGRAERLSGGVALKVYMQIAEAMGLPLYTLFYEEISPIEIELIQAFRDLPEERRKGWVDALQLAKKEKAHSDKEY